MYQTNYEEPKSKSILGKVVEKITENSLYKLTQIILVAIAVVYGETRGLINFIDMNPTQILLLVAFLGMIVLLNYFHKKMVRKEISNAVDYRFGKIEDDIHHIYNHRKISINNRLIQNDLNRIIAKSLSELEKDELENILQKNQKNLIQHVVGDGNVTKPDAGNIVSEFMANRDYDPIKMRDHLK